MVDPIGLNTVDVDTVPAVTVGPGCLRRDLPSRDGVRIWLVDMAPGAEWPRADAHDERGEDIFVARGELIEGNRRLTAGAFIHFDPDSSHRPRTEQGVRLFGFNLA